MTAPRVPLGILAILHYGRALKENARNSDGPFDVYGSSGNVGKHDKSLVSFPTIVVGRKGSVGHVTYAPHGGWPIDTAFYLELLDPARVDLRYLYWVLIYARLGRRAVTTSIPGLTRDELSRTRILLPTIDDQRRIATILDRTDLIRQRRRESMHILHEFLRSSFLAIFGEPTTNKNGYQIVRLGDVVADAQYGTSVRANADGVGRAVLRMNNITTDGRINTESLKWCEIPPRDVEKYTVRRGDLLFNRTNSPELVGKTAVWDRSDSYAFAGYLIRMRFDESRILPEYVSHYLNSAHGKRLLFLKAKASNNMSNISASELQRLPIMLPPLTHQRKYLGIHARVAKTRHLLEASAQLADTLFASLAHDVLE